MTGSRRRAACGSPDNARTISAATLGRERAGGDPFLAEQPQPEPNGGDLAGVDVDVVVTRDQVGGPVHIPAHQRMADRLVRRSRCPVPAARPLVQDRYDAELGPGQLGPQDLGEEMVVTEPLPALVERHQEQVLSLEQLDDRGRVGRAGEGITKRRAEPGEDRDDLVRNRYTSARLLAEHVVHQKIDDEPVVAGELAYECAWRRVTAQGQRRQVQPGRPSLGPDNQIFQVVIGELDVGDVPDQHGRLREIEAQFACPDLGHLPAARMRASSSGGSARVMMTTWTDGGR